MFDLDPLPILLSMFNDIKNWKAWEEISKQSWWISRLLSEDTKSRIEALQKNIDSVFNDMKSKILKVKDRRVRKEA